MKRLALYVFTLIGLADSIFLTYEHYNPLAFQCTPGSILDCGKVLNSEYAFILGVPVAVWGVIHYSYVLIMALILHRFPSRIGVTLLLLETAVGLAMTVYFVAMQLFVIGAICYFCMLSAVCTTIIIILVQKLYRKEALVLRLTMFQYLYAIFGKPLFFLIDPEVIHTRFMHAGEIIGNISFLKRAIRRFFRYPKTNVLEQTIAGIPFPNPVGLSAGYDYEARLTGILGAVGFGFQSVGTITNQHYEGNKGPMLGRLPKSKSLLVNKGFKNDGAAAVVEKLTDRSFDIPVGVSIGVTNNVSIDTEKKAIEDIVAAFQTFETAHMNHAFYELNISCPNLKVPIDFYNPPALKTLLTAVTKLKLSRPVFLKMPIDKSDQESLALVQIAVDHSMAGVIFGNLKKDRADSAFDAAEMKTWEGKKGNFSGKPTWKRSNELISCVYKKFGKKITIIGCGGIFSPEDAYEKILLGASLVQLITGMIYQGPQLISQTNALLEDYLHRDGFNHISEAVGSKNRSK